MSSSNDIIIINTDQSPGLSSYNSIKDHQVINTDIINPTKSIELPKISKIIETPTVSTQIIILSLICLISINNYFCYHEPSAIASEYERYYQLNTQQFGTMFTIYSAPNVILVFFSGQIIDNFGLNQASLLFNSIILIGMLIGALTPSVDEANPEIYMMLLLSRLLLGLGGESIVACVSTMISKWFSHTSHLNTAMSINQAVVQLLGSSAAFYILPHIDSIYLSQWMTVMICFISLLVNIRYNYYEKYYALYLLEINHMDMMNVDMNGDVSVGNNVGNNVGMNVGNNVGNSFGNKVGNNVGMNVEIHVDSTGSDVVGYKVSKDLELTEKISIHDNKHRGYNSISHRNDNESMDSIETIDNMPKYTFNSLDTNVYNTNIPSFSIFNIFRFNDFEDNQRYVIIDDHVGRHTHSSTSSSQSTYVHSILSILSKFPYLFWLLLLHVGLVSPILYTFTAFGPLYLQDIGINAIEAGNAISLLYLSIILSPVSGIIIDYVGYRSYIQFFAACNLPVIFFCLIYKVSINLLIAINRQIDR